MKKFEIEKIGFPSFMKLMAIIGLCAGIGYAIIAAMAASIGLEVTTKMGQTTYTGLAAALWNFLVAPLSFIIILIVLGLLAYLPLKGLFKLLGKITLSLRTKE